MMTGMDEAIDPRLRVAVDAGLDWYVAMCAAHGVRSRLADGVWRALDQMPPLHSAAVVVEPGSGTAAVEAALAEAPHRGVADCLGGLDLSSQGLEPLFEATWLHLPAPSPAASASSSGVWRRVTTAEDLARWNAAGDTEGVLVPAMLERPTFAMLGADRAPLGCVATLGTGAVYLSNVRASGDEWAEVVAAVAATFPGRPVVTYARGTPLAAALSTGFEPVGTTRIWVG
jgi:hypothetical protein